MTGIRWAETSSNVSWDRSHGRLPLLDFRPGDPLLLLVTSSSDHWRPIQICSFRTPLQQHLLGVTETEARTGRHVLKSDINFISLSCGLSGWQACNTTLFWRFMLFFKFLIIETSGTLEKRNAVLGNIAKRIKFS